MVAVGCFAYFAIAALSITCWDPVAPVGAVMAAIAPVWLVISYAMLISNLDWLLDRGLHRSERRGYGINLMLLLPGIIFTLYVLGCCIW